MGKIEGVAGFVGLDGSRRATMGIATGVTSRGEKDEAGMVCCRVVEASKGVEKVMSSCDDVT